MWTLWRNIKVLPPDDQPEKRRKAVDVYANSFFKYLRGIGFNSKDILHLVDRLMAKVLEQMQRDNMPPPPSKSGS